MSKYRNQKRRENKENGWDEKDDYKVLLPSAERMAEQIEKMISIQQDFMKTMNDMSKECSEMNKTKTHGSIKLTFDGHGGISHNKSQAFIFHF